MSTHIPAHSFFCTAHGREVRYHIRQVTDAVPLSFFRKHSVPKLLCYFPKVAIEGWDSETRIEPAMLTEHLVCPKCLALYKLLIGETT